jgi:hypothetical protein
MSSSGIPEKKTTESRYIITYKIIPIGFFRPQQYSVRFNHNRIVSKIRKN